MREIKFDVDYTFCPKGHSWTFIPASTMYSAIFWCKECDCFYTPVVESLTKEKLNEQFSSDRALDLIKFAEFIRWKKGLNRKDMEKYKSLLK